MNHSKETKIDLELLEDLLDSQERSSSGMKFKKLIPMIVLNWQYFLFSFIIFVSGAILYLRYTEPTYKLSARMLIKDDQKKNSNASQLLTNMMDLGFVTNSSGIDNEVEVMQSRILMRDVVRELHLNADFRIKGHIMDKIVYRKQAVNVELDPVVLDSLDKDYMEWGEISSIQMDITRKKEAENPEKYYIEVIMQEKIKLYLQYVEKQSFLYDITLIFKTFWMIVTRESE